MASMAPPPPPPPKKAKRSAAVAAKIALATANVEAMVAKHGTAPAGAVTPCNSVPLYGTGPEVTDFATVQAKKKIKLINRTGQDKLDLQLASEQIGERAGITVIMQLVEGKGLAFDPAGLVTHSASGVLNLTYIHPAPPPGSTPSTFTPEFVIVVECKGGSSQCGTRTSQSGTSVEQGTIAYVEDVSAVMATSNYKPKSTAPADVQERKRRRETGEYVQNAIKKKTGSYIVVQGSYSDTALNAPEIRKSETF